jgi:hypothetical protein
VALAGALGASSATTAFLVAGLFPVLLSGVALFGVGLRRDEERHPLSSSLVGADLHAGG